MKKVASIYIILAAALWGGTGVFVRNLSAEGLSPVQIAVIRVTVSAVVMLVYLLTKDPRLLRIDPKHWVYFFGTGVLSLSFFNVCYFTAIQYSTLAAAAALLYTAPTFVMLLSVLVFHEPMSCRKFLALAMTIAGTVLVTGVLAGNGGVLEGKAILAGLGAGFGYALYSIFGKVALNHYHPATVSFYTFVFGFMGLIPFAHMGSAVHLLFLPQTLINGLGIGVLCCMLPYLFYSMGLARVEASRAAILAAAEPAVAAWLGIAFFQEALTLVKLLGMAFILGAIGILNTKSGGKDASAREAS